MTFANIIISIAVLIFGLLLVISAFRLRRKEAVVLSFNALYYLWISLKSFSPHRCVGNHASTPVPRLIHSPIYSCLAMILAFGGLTLTFLKRHRGILIGYWAASLIVLALWIVFTPNVWVWGNLSSNPGY